MEKLPRYSSQDLRHQCQYIRLGDNVSLETIRPRPKRHGQLPFPQALLIVKQLSTVFLKFKQ